MTARREAAEAPLRAFVDDLYEQRRGVQRMPDTAVFLNRDRTSTPLAMRSNVRHNHHLLHERVVIAHVTISVGYIQQADVPSVLAAIPDESFESPIDFENASYFLSTIDIEMGDVDSSSPHLDRDRIRHELRPHARVAQSDRIPSRTARNGAVLSRPVPNAPTAQVA